MAHFNGSTPEQLAKQTTELAVAHKVKLEAMAKELGVPVKEVEEYITKLAYRKEYNTRPSVVAARKIRNAKKAATQKAFREMLKADPSLREEVDAQVELVLAKG
jgi:NACalpha-BTF3-like transcription factor